jgi:hypothetical protein
MAAMTPIDVVGVTRNGGPATIAVRARDTAGRPIDAVVTAGSIETQLRGASRAAAGEAGGTARTTGRAAIGVVSARTMRAIRAAPIERTAGTPAAGMTGPDATAAARENSVGPVAAATTARGASAPAAMRGMIGTATSGVVETANRVRRTGTGAAARGATIGTMRRTARPVGVRGAATVVFARGGGDDPDTTPDVPAAMTGALSDPAIQKRGTAMPRTGVECAAARKVNSAGVSRTASA